MGDVLRMRGPRWGRPLTYRRQLRRSKGPRQLPGPRGVIRASYARCGFCQRIDARPAGRLDLRAWTRTTELGVVHRRCLAYGRDVYSDSVRSASRRDRVSYSVRSYQVGEWVGPVRATWSPPGEPARAVRIVGTHPRAAGVVRVDLGTVKVRRSVRVRSGRAVTLAVPEHGGCAWAELRHLSPADTSQGVLGLERVKLRP